jgi:serine/threonine protein kinase
VRKSVLESIQDSGKLIDLGTEGLGALVLDHLHASGGNPLREAYGLPHNLANALAARYSVGREEVYKRLVSACHWLIHQGFLEVIDSEGFFEISRKGNAAKTEAQENAARLAARLSPQSALVSESITKTSPKYDFPRIELTDAEMMWLRTICNRFLSGYLADVDQLKKSLRAERKWPSNFRPSEIDYRLYQRDNIPTMLGVWHADPNSEWIPKLDEVIRYIKSKLAETTKVQINDIAQKLKLSDLNVTILIHLLPSIGFGYTATGKPSPRNTVLIPGQLGIYDRLELDDPEKMDPFLSYENLEAQVNKFYGDASDAPENRAEEVARANKPRIQTTDKSLLIGRRYRILRPLSMSNFSKTFLAEDTFMPSKRRCVVKQYAYSSADRNSEEMMVQRFNDEAATLERLAFQHDQIPDLYAHISEDGNLYLVQEYVDGETVAERVASRGVFEEVEVREILTSVLRVVQYIHAHSLIHRDIKPNNILIRKNDNKPVLIDFGAIKKIARTLVDPLGHASTSVRIGTLGYMAPEQAAGRPRFASDIYALGFTGIFMLTGKGPEELNDLLTATVDWHQYAPNVSAGFAEILDTAINWDFGDRFLEAVDMLKAIESPTQNQLDAGLRKKPEISFPPDVPSSLGEANMPQVATQWLREFLTPVIGLLNEIRTKFSSNSFLLSASQILPYNPVYEYKVDFFRRERWELLTTSDVGEYFLTRFEQVREELHQFEIQMNRFTECFNQLVQSIEDSPVFLRELIETYARLVERERISRSQFAESDLTEIAVHVLGQLRLQISHHRSQSKEALVRFTAYSRLGLNVEFPTNSLSEDHTLMAFCHDAFKELEEDPVIAESVKDTKIAFEEMKNNSRDLWKQLKDLRIEIATRYNATIE